MQQYSRTIFTSDAYKLKMSSIEQEYSYKIDVNEKEMTNTKEQIKKLERSNIGVGWLNNIIRRIWFFYLVS